MRGFVRSHFDTARGEGRGKRRRKMSARRGRRVLKGRSGRTDKRTREDCTHEQHQAGNGWSAGEVVRPHVRTTVRSRSRFWDVSSGVSRRDPLGKGLQTLAR